MTCFGDLLAGLGPVIASIVSVQPKRVKSRVPKVGVNPDRRAIQVPPARPCLGQ